MEVAVPLEVCWTLWEDRQRIPLWMPWIKSVTVQQDNPALSRWTLSTHQFGRCVLAVGLVSQLWILSVTVQQNNPALSC